ncbi:hypothetical protein [Curvibacter microcysteis]|uniref:hypothetical protein n=1 Tax=Curvibacter microcysteis TaxID=3026419 RepID=UPI002362DB04|nr:hypothetical protein [Curvibacter sp. HBC28]
MPRPAPPLPQPTAAKWHNAFDEALSLEALVQRRQRLPQVPHPTPTPPEAEPLSPFSAPSQRP